MPAKKATRNSPRGTASTHPKTEPAEVLKKAKKATAHVENAFSRAEKYVKDPTKLMTLFDQAREKTEKTDPEPFKETWAYLLAMLRLTRAYAGGSYRDVPWQSLVLIVGAIIYFLSPLDAIPDFLPGGLIDDVAVVALTLRSVKVDLDLFMAWETAQL